MAELLGLAQDAASNVTDLRLGAASKVLLAVRRREAASDNVPEASEAAAARLGAKSSVPRREAASDNVPEASEAAAA